MSKNYYEKVIGQTRAKEKLSFYLEKAATGVTPFPNILLTGSKGDGKTHFAQQTAKNLIDRQNPDKNHKDFYKLNGGQIKNVRMFFEDICSKFADGDQYATVFIDEAHALPKEIQNGVLLTILEPNKTRMNSFTYDDIPYIFDFNKITFIFATTEDDKIFHAFKDRLMEIQLEPYSKEELAQIVEFVIDGATDFDKDVLENVAGFIRRNARAADRMAVDVMSFNVPVFQQKHLDELVKRTSLLPNGLNQTELLLMKILRDNGEMSLGHLSSKLARPSRAVQKEIESYPISLGYVTIDGKRRITGKGREYLEKLNV